MSKKPEDRDTLWALLSEGLDLCVRARSMDSMDRRGATLAASVNAGAWEESGLLDRHIARNNIERPHAPIHTKSATVHLWLQEQYDQDLAAWESRARAQLIQSPL